MAIVAWLGLVRIRRTVAAASVLLSTGGLVLLHAQPGQALPTPAFTKPSVSNSASFAGKALHGSVAFSHSRVFSGRGGDDVYAEVKLEADRDDGQRARAPLGLAVVIDTSGSMSGEKMDQAKDAVLRLIREMRDDDQIAIVRYSDDVSVVQRLARVGDVRTSAQALVGQLSAGGGTAIPLGLSAGLSALDEAERGRVRRVVLVSDGLDSTRAQAEHLAKLSAERGITISTMGIGLDFDESYMSGVSRAGHGNFAFVKDGAALVGFLRRELEETASTTVERATVRIELPAGLEFVSAVGAAAHPSSGRGVELSFGSLFAGDSRRAIVKLHATLPDTASVAVFGTAEWTPVGDAHTDAAFSGIRIAGSDHRDEVAASIDHAVLADVTSVTASTRELEAAEAYARGDTERAQLLIDKNIADLKQAAVLAPAPAATALEKQRAAYSEQKREFAAAPGSSEGKAAAKKAFATDSSNVGRSFFSR